MTHIPTTPAPKKPMRRGLLGFLLLVVTLCVLLGVAIFYVMTTDDGTKWVLSNIAKRTGVTLNHERGTLAQGIDVTDVRIKVDDVTVTANHAHLKLGWRAVLLQQVHLLDSTVDELVIHNAKAPTGEPFDYMTIKTPVPIYGSNVTVNVLKIEQTTKKPVSLYDIHVAQVRWADADISVSGGRLDVEREVKIDKASGNITLSGDYPLDVVADVKVLSLDKVFVDTLQAHAKGTLKRTHGTVVSRYNGGAVQGEFVAQSLSDEVPFYAKVRFDKVVLPYADEQNITLSDGVVSADGTLDDIELRFNAQMVGKDVPKGRYQGRAMVHVADEGMSVDFVQAQTSSGTLTGNAKMSWADEFEMKATLTGDGVKVRELMPLDYQDYQAYLPTSLTGTLGVDYWYLDKDKNTKWVFDLKQQDGERIEASLSQSQAKPKSAWHIQADWQKLIRHHVPDIEAIDSPHGTAKVTIHDSGVVDVHAKALIHRLSVAPKGEYDVHTTIKDKHIKLPKFDYEGEIGLLAGQGNIHLAQKNEPLRWQFDVNSKKIMPNRYLGDDATPFESIFGRLSASGVMGEQSKLAKHDITIKDSDLTAVMKDGKDTIHLVGAGTGTLLLLGSELKNFNINVQGDVAQSILPQLPKTTFKAQATGDLSNIAIETLYLKNPSLDTTLAGKLKLTDGIDWDLTANVSHLDSQKFVQDSSLIAKLQGKLATKGRYHQDKLEYVQAVFDGKLKENQLLTGDVSLDVLGRGDVFTINHARHQGQAGDFWTKGKVDIAKLSWDVVANMKAFNVGAFVKGVDSTLTGGFATQGVWGDTQQRFALTGLDITGQLNDESVKATGSLSATLRLPKDLAGYFHRLRKATQIPKTPNDFFALQQQIQDNSRQTQHIFEALKADNLTVQVGDNIAKMDGTERHLTTTLDIKELSQLWAEAQGVIKGGFIIMNDKHALPTVYADLSATGVRTADVIVEKASVLGKVVNLAQSPSHLRLETDNVIALGRVVQKAHLDFQGTQGNHRVSFGSKNASLQTQAVVTGGFDGSRYQGIVSDGQMQTRFGRLFQRQPTEFGYVLSNHQVKVAPHCWQTQAVKSTKAGVLCLAETLSYSPQGGDVNVVVQDLDTSVLSPALPSDIVWQSTLNGKIKANWQAGKVPFVNAVLYSDNGRVGVTQEDTGYVEMPYERVSLLAQSLPSGLKVRADVAGSAGQGYADVVIDPYRANKPLKGALVFHDMNLAVVRPFFPNLQALSGSINMAGGIAGTLNKPQFYGSAELTDGRLAIFGVPLALTNMNVTAKINGTNATLDGRFQAGEGEGVMDGVIDWQNSPQAKFGISGENLTISSPPLLTASVSPEFEVLIRPTQNYVNIKGIVLVPSATIRPPEVSDDIVSESGDVSVIDRRLVGNINQILVKSKPWSINADIGLDLGSDVSFRGFGARLPLAGTLHLTQSGQGSMKARGVVQVSERTTIDGIGQNLELNYAQIRFNGDMLNPRLSIEGEKEIQGQTVGVRVKGTASSPDITVFNDAGLTEQQAMNALITGRIDEAGDTQTSEQAFRSRVTNSLAAAGLSLGLSGTRGITNQIGNALGLESLTVDASGNSSDTSVNITGYISPDLYIRYGVGVFNAETQLSMRYQLTRRVYIEASRALENTIDVIYRWKF